MKIIAYVIISSLALVSYPVVALRIIRNVTQQEEAFLAAAFDGDLETVERVLIEGVNVNVKTPERETALTFSARGGHPDVVAILLKAGADWRIKNNQGQMAYDLAANEQTKDVFKEMVPKRREFIQKTLEEVGLVQPEIIDVEIMKYFR